MKLQLKTCFAISLLTTGLLILPLSNSNAAGTADATTTSRTTTMNNTQNDYIAPTYQDVLVAKVPTYNNQSKDLRLNIYKPQNVTELTPVLIYIHGGGWATGTYAEPSAANASTAAQSQALSKLPPKVYSATTTGQLMANDNRSSLEVFKEVVRHGITLVSIDYRLNSEAPHGNQGQLVNETMVKWLVDKLTAPSKG